MFHDIKYTPSLQNQYNMTRNMWPHNPTTSPSSWLEKESFPSLPVSSSWWTVPWFGCKAEWRVSRRTPLGLHFFRKLKSHTPWKTDMEPHLEDVCQNGWFWGSMFLFGTCFFPRGKHNVFQQNGQTLAIQRRLWFVKVLEYTARFVSTMLDLKRQVWYHCFVGGSWLVRIVKRRGKRLSD